MTQEREAFFDRLKAGLEDGIKHLRGEIELKTTEIELPEDNPQIRSDEAGATKRSIRRKR